MSLLVSAGTAGAVCPVVKSGWFAVRTASSGPGNSLSEGIWKGIRAVMIFLRPGASGCHGGFGDQEPLCDVRGGHVADQPQRERDLSLDGHRRVKAQEDQPWTLAGRSR
jgi:hypothetical protein